MKHKVVFDIGANWGEDSLQLTSLDPNISAYAFEPTPELYEHLKIASRSFKERYNLYRIALSDFNGTAAFNVAAHDDWGTSSLLKFNDRLNETWPGRTDFYVDRVIDVAVLRFDTWFEIAKPKIEKIDFFHCDTQGSDLRVLKGMGDLFEMIVEGVVEVPHNDRVKLYQDQHSREEMYDFLSDWGYEVFDVKPQQNEDNIFFRKKYK